MLIQLDKVQSKQEMLEDRALEQYLVNQAIPLKPYSSSKTNNSKSQRTLTHESLRQQNQLLNDPYLKRQEVIKRTKLQTGLPQGSKQVKRSGGGVGRQSTSPRRQTQRSPPSSQNSQGSQSKLLPIIPETGDASIALLPTGIRGTSALNNYKNAEPYQSQPVLAQASHINNIEKALQMVQQSPYSRAVITGAQSMSAINNPD